MERVTVVLGGCSLVLLQACNPSAPRPHLELEPAVAAQSFARSARFERNRGQADARVDFIARTTNATALISPQQLVLALKDRAELHLLRMTLVDAGPAKPVMSGQLTARTNYLVGSANAVRGVEQYAEVGYDDVYPGVALRYHDAHGALEYDFIVAARADPDLIRFAFDGHDRVALLESGHLELLVHGRRVTLEPPQLWQQMGDRKVEIAGQFELNGDTVSFDVGNYDRSLPLTIDPTVIIYSTYAGGTADDDPQGIAVGSDSAVYITGCTHSTDFPVTGSAYQSTIASSEDAFIAKFSTSASGTASLVYATYLGSTDRDCAYSIEVDSAGRAFVTGITWGADFPVSADAFKGTWTKSSPDEEDGFVSALTPAGDALYYSTFFGGTSDDLGYDLALHPNGNLIYITGDKGQNAGVWVIDRTGQALKYENTIGSTLAYGRAIGIAQDGKAVVAGIARSDTLPTTTNAFMRTKPAEVGSYGPPSFVAHIDVDQAPASSILYLSYIGAGRPEDMVVNAAGQAYIVGTTSSSGFPTTAGAYDTVCEDLVVNSNNVGCQRDAFVMKFDPSLSGTASLVFSTRFGGVRGEYGSGIAVDGDGRIVITGASDSDNLPLVSPISGTTSPGVFVARLTADATALDLSTFIGDGSARGVVMHPSGDICITGRTSSSSFPMKNAYDNSYNGSGDGFVTRIGGQRCTSYSTPDRGHIFDWIPPELPYCIEWEGPRPGLGLPRRCDPLPGCPRCAEGLGRAALGDVATPALHDLAGTVLLADTKLPPQKVRRDWSALNRRLDSVGARGFYTNALRSKVLSAVRNPPSNARQKAAAGAVLNEALNALELNRRIPSALLRATRGNQMILRSGPGMRVGGKDTGANDVALQLVAGLPAMPETYTVGWPYVTLSIAGDKQVDVEIDTRWLDFGDAGPVQLLEWDGREFRNAGARYMANGMLTGVFKPGSKYIIVRGLACLRPLQP